MKRLKSIALALLISAGLLLVNQGCFNLGPFGGIRGEGQTVEKKVEFREIRGVVVHNSAEVLLSQGSRQDVIIKAQENILENLILDVENGILHIRNERPVWQAEPIIVKMVIADLEILKLSGSGSVQTETGFRDQRVIESAISGSGTISLNTNAREIKAKISGSGTIELKGTCNDLDLNISGSGGVLGYAMETRKVNCQISGSGNIRVYASDRLEARISGSGNVYYRGNPKISSNVSGSGDLIAR